MMPNDPAVYAPIWGIVAMALATYFTRVAGFWLMTHVPMTLRVRRMLETLPGAIVVAIIVPLAARAGAPGFIGIGVTFASMLLRRNEFLAVALGLISISLARAFWI
jgi:branched chain amino acid efflux pump